MLFINRWFLGVSSLFWLIELPRVGSGEFLSQLTKLTAILKKRGKVKLMEKLSIESESRNNRGTNRGNSLPIVYKVWKNY
jgi:hypothetical protein